MRQTDWKTELGERLWAIRQKIVASGLPLLDWNGVEREVRQRRLWAKYDKLGDRVSALEAKP